jgi:hypothetical protein
VNDEFRFVIDGLEIGLVHEMRGQFHAMDQVVEAGAVVHHLERAGDEEFERGGNRVEHARDARLAGDGKAMSREQKLRLLRRHFAQRLRPFEREALHLLRVAGIRKNPGDEIARADRFMFRHPGPEMIVRLADGMAQLEAEIAGAELHRLAEGDVGIDPGIGTEAAGRRRRAVLVALAHAHAQFGGGGELARIDGEVVAVGELVAAEAREHVLVAGDARARTTLFAGLADEGAGAADMVGMAMRVADMGDRLVGPFAQRLQNALPESLEARVEEDEAVAGAEGDDMGEGLDEGDTVRNLGKLRRRTVDEARAFIEVVVDVARGGREKIGHVSLPFYP